PRLGGDPGGGVPGGAGPGRDGARAGRSHHRHGRPGPGAPPGDGDGQGRGGGKETLPAVLLGVTSPNGLSRSKPRFSLFRTAFFRLTPFLALASIPPQWDEVG